MRHSSTGSPERTVIAVLILGTIVMALTVLPAAPHAMASPSFLSSVSSAACENNDSLFSSSFSCSLSVTARSTIVVFLGCLSDTPANCDNPSVVDSQGFKYSYIALGYLAEVTCSGDLCIEYAFVATASTTGTDTLTFATAGRGYLGGDAYDIMGINASSYVGGTGVSPMNLYPSLTNELPDTTGRFVVAGVIANDALEYSQSLTPDWNFIPGQPCYPCGQNGGWQASVYQTVGNDEQTNIRLYYGDALQTNAGWAMLALSFAPNVSTTSISCTPSPAMVTLASTCTATVRGDAPTGNVTWTAGGTGSFSSSSCTLSSGACTVSYTPSAPPSSVKISASYGGDVYNPGSSGSYSLTAVKDVTTVTVQCTPSPAAAGSTTTCTASTSGDSPTGTMTWTTSGVASFSPAASCTLSSGACAVYYTPSPSASPLTITAAYSGDGNNDPGMGTFALAVSAAASSTSASSSTSTTTSSSSATISNSTTTSATSTTTSCSFSATISSTTTSTSTSRTGNNPCGQATKFIEMTLTTANLPVNIGVNGTITASQFSPITLTGNLSGSVLDVSFVVSGTHGTTGTATITIPKSAVPPGDLPRVYLNGTVAAVQSYTQDVNSYYVTFSTQFSYHLVQIEFSPVSGGTSTASSSSTSQSSASSLQTSYLVVVGVVAAVLLTTTTVVRVRRRHELTHFQKSNLT